MSPALQSSSIVWSTCYSAIKGFPINCCSLIIGGFINLLSLFMVRNGCLSFSPRGSPLFIGSTRVPPLTVACLIFLKPSFIGNKNIEHVHHVNEICKSSFIYLWNHLPHGVCCLVFFLVFFCLGKRESFYSQT